MKKVNIKNFSKNLYLTHGTPDGKFVAYDNSGKIAITAEEGTPRAMSAKRNPQKTAIKMFDAMSDLAVAGYQSSQRMIKNMQDIYKDLVRSGIKF